MDENQKRNIFDEAKRIEEDALFSSKGHFNDAARWEKYHLCLGIPSTAAAAIAGSFAFSKECGLLIGLLSTFSAVCTAILTFVNPSEKATNHQNAGASFNALKNDARIFSKVTVEVTSETQLIIKELKELNERRTLLNKESPKISKCGFEKARKGIEKGEATYSVDQQKNS